MTTEVENHAGPAVALEESAGIVIARMQHPPANPLSPPVLDGLDAAADLVERSEAAALVICSGIGGFFAAGADIKHMRSLDGAGFAAYGGRMREVFARIAGLSAVSIAAIEGVALGGGLELALACKLRIGSGAGRLGVPEIKLGLIPGAGGTQRLPRVIGRSRALDLLVTGRQVAAEEAFAIGLLDRLVPEGEAEPVALDIARRVAEASLPALAATEHCLDAAAALDLDAGIVVEAAQEQALFEDGEAREGFTAFLERRAPVFASARARSENGGGAPA